MGKKRATRCDKKRDVRLTVHTEFKEVIYRLSYITEVSVMDTVEEMVLFAMRSKRILESMSTRFVRNIKIDNILYVGQNNPERFEPTPIRNPNYVRIKTRLTQNDFHILSAIAYGLDIRPARACTILITEAFHSQYFLDNHIKKYISENISDRNLLDLKYVMEYANRDENYNLNWGDLMSYLMREITEPIESIVGKTKLKINSWKSK